MSERALSINFVAISKNKGNLFFASLYHSMLIRKTKRKSAQIAAESSRKRITPEIESGKLDAVYNIRKDLEAGFDKVISLVFGKKT